MPENFNINIGLETDAASQANFEDLANDIQEPIDKLQDEIRARIEDLKNRIDTSSSSLPEENGGPDGGRGPFQSQFLNDIISTALGYVFGRGITEAISFLSEKIQDLTRALDESIDRLSPFSPEIQRTQALSEILLTRQAISQADALGPQLSQYLASQTQAEMATRELIATIEQQFGEVITSINVLKTAFTLSISDSIESWVESLKEDLGPLFAPIAEFLTEYFANLRKLIDDRIGPLEGANHPLEDEISGMFNFSPFIPEK